jgi:hypothetical protein
MEWPTGIVLVTHAGDVVGTTLTREGLDENGYELFAASPVTPVAVEDVAGVHIRRMPAKTSFYIVLPMEGSPVELEI